MTHDNYDLDRRPVVLSFFFDSKEDVFDWSLQDAPVNETDDERLSRMKDEFLTLALWFDAKREELVQIGQWPIEDLCVLRRLTAQVRLAYVHDERDPVQAANDVLRRFAHRIMGSPFTDKPGGKIDFLTPDNPRIEIIQIYGCGYFRDFYDSAMRGLVITGVVPGDKNHEDD